MSIFRFFLFFFSVGLCSIIVTGHQVCAQNNAIRFAPLPMEKQETTLTKFQPLAQFLSEHLDTELEFIYSTSYSTILEKFRNSEIDLAYLGPLPYVKLRSEFLEAVPVIFFKQSAENATYTCSVVTFPDNHFDLMRGELQTVALTQPLSTCGYLSVNGIMAQHGNSLENNLYRYVGAHDEVALSVIRGDFKAGGLKTSVANKYKHMGLYILAETGPLPPFALVANTRTLSSEIIEAISSGLLSLGDNTAGELTPEIKKIIGKGVTKGDDTAYEIVRLLQGTISIPEEGNF